MPSAKEIAPSAIYVTTNMTNIIYVFKATGCGWLSARQLKCLGDFEDGCESIRDGSLFYCVYGFSHQMYKG